MNFESHAEPLPELRKSRNPAENKNHDFLVQARLMARSPLPEMEWAERFAAAFRTLFDTDHEFRDLVNGPIDDDSLKRTQETLDRFVEQH